MPSRAELIRNAQDLEASLDEFPDERDEILLEAVEAWRAAGEHERALALLGQAVDQGGESGAEARVALADALFDLGRVEEAEAALEELRRSRPATPYPYQLAAELVQERGDLGQAAHWYDMAAARLTDEQLGSLREELGFLSIAHSIVTGRRRVREALGLPPDRLDESAATSDEVPDVLARLAERLTPAPPRTRVLFWTRDGLAEAHRRWPELVQDDDVAAVVRDRELANRELAATSTGKITMVLLSADGLAGFAERTGGDPASAATRTAFAEEIAAAGGEVAWPPGRNDRCWCGSAAKYKKCCGRP
ncbi:SEC-C domain-containing protein [Saccharothrix longispora]|uniref:SEC-C domain-containing protein n=1 Tax=Saccharothrix longispora TaxID=33920 RepID=UPI0028FD2B2C|nr:SEC-C domain-containing protein [Saccharothrix longispora]MDU0291871.1 SEC-C domain-containing protein [Saccharothrix longispora]